jgi:hypothetical protein
MRTSIVVAGLALILGVAPVSALAQQADIEFQPLPDTAPLAITVNPAPVPKGDAPHFVTITLTNTSDQAVRFPMPAIGCANAASGYVALVTAKVASAPQCGSEEMANHLLDPKHWTVLRPGETANFGQMITPLLPKAAGTFEVRAVYVPAQLSAESTEQLYRDSIVYPKEKLTSAPAAIIREAAE